jgi:hypothetical protein
VSVGKQLAAVVEDDYAVAQQAPTLLGMRGHHASGRVVAGIGCRTRGLVLTHGVHLPSFSSSVSALALSVAIYTAATVIEAPVATSVFQLCTT